MAVEAVRAGAADFGVIPVENSTEGAVGRTLEPHRILGALHGIVEAHHPRPGALVVLVDGLAVVYVDRGGGSIQALPAAVAARTRPQCTYNLVSVACTRSSARCQSSHSAAASRRSVTKRARPCPKDSARSEPSRGGGSPRKCASSARRAPLARGRPLAELFPEVERRGLLARL